ncbi:hypothetical protein BGX31_009229 [Mortierella sp. GBA43]|nr:hypothetical protein BGX31_009229 [Mortierella sp. GBA43]
MYIAQWKPKISPLCTLLFLIFFSTTSTFVRAQSIDSIRPLNRNAQYNASRPALSSLQEPVTNVLREKRGILGGFLPGPSTPGSQPSSSLQPPSYQPPAPQPVNPPPAHSPLPAPTQPTGSPVLNPGSDSGSGATKGDGEGNEGFNEPTSKDPSGRSTDNGGDGKKRPTSTNGSKGSGDAGDKSNNDSYPNSSSGTSNNPQDKATDAQDGGSYGGGNGSATKPGTKGTFSSDMIAVVVVVLLVIITAISFSCYRIRQATLRRQRRKTAEDGILKDPLGPGMGMNGTSFRTSVGTDIGVCSLAPRSPMMSGSAAASVVGTPGVIGGFAGPEYDL